eukprot:EG_transcript_47625
MCDHAWYRSVTHDIFFLFFPPNFIIWGSLACAKFRHTLRGGKLHEASVSSRSIFSAIGSSCFKHRRSDDGELLMVCKEHKEAINCLMAAPNRAWSGAKDG